MQALALQLDHELFVAVADEVLRRGTATSAVREWAALPLAPHLDTLVAATPSVPAHYAWVERDTRSFWYSAGAGGLASLGVHLLVGIPVTVIGGTWVGSLAAAGTPAAVAVALGLFCAYAVAEAAVSSAVATLVFDSLSSTYESHFASGFFGHLAGTGAAVAVAALTLGGGVLLFHGLGVLSEFTGSAGFSTIGVFSLLGAMPAVLIVGAALVALPAVASSYALAVGATAKSGYEIDEDWQRPTQEGRVFDPARARQFSVAAPMVTMHLP